MDEPDLLLKYLESYEPALREESARSLGLLGDSRAVAPLIQRLVGDTTGSVRRAAAIALGRLGDRRALEPLADALVGDNDSVVRRRAATALGELGDPRAIEPLIGALRDISSGVPGYAALALDKLGEPWYEPFHKRIGEPDVNVRGSIMLSLRHFTLNGEYPFGIFVAAAKDPHYLVRHIAVARLVETAPRRAADTLIEALADESDFVRQKAAEALGEIKDRRAVLALIDAMTDDRDDTILGWAREAAIKALVKIGDERAIKPLREIVEFEDLDMRATALWALADFGEAGFRCLLELRQHDDSAVRWWAVAGLQYCGEPAFEYVLESLQDPDTRVRTHAIECLRSINPSRAVLPIILALRDENSDVRWTAAQCLGTTGDERAMSALEYVRDHDTGEATYNAYTTRLSEVAADAIWTIRRAKNPNLFKINGVECELQPDGTWKWLNDPDQPATGDSPNSDG